jgi:hypothetical protein
MKKLAILFVFFLTFVSCNQKGEVITEEPKDDFLAVPKYEETPTTPKNTYTPMAKNTVEFHTGDSTYWYVILDEVDGANWHGTVTLGTPYFDFYEARRQFEGAKNEGYFEFILQINKESVVSFDRYAKNKKHE